MGQDTEIVPATASGDEVISRNVESLVAMQGQPAASDSTKYDELMQGRPLSFDGAERENVEEVRPNPMVKDSRPRQRDREQTPWKDRVAATSPYLDPTRGERMFSSRFRRGLSGGRSDRG